MLIAHERIINNNQNKTISVATREHYHCKLFIILLLSAAVKLNLFSLL